MRGLPQPCLSFGEGGEDPEHTRRKSGGGKQAHCFTYYSMTEFLDSTLFIRSMCAIINRSRSRWRRDCADARSAACYSLASALGRMGKTQKTPGERAGRKQTHRVKTEDPGLSPSTRATPLPPYASDDRPQPGALLRLEYISSPPLRKLPRPAASSSGPPRVRCHVPRTSRGGSGRRARSCSSCRTRSADSAVTGTCSGRPRRHSTAPPFPDCALACRMCRMRRERGVASPALPPWATAAGWVASARSRPSPPPAAPATHRYPPRRGWPAPPHPGCRCPEGHLLPRTHGH